MKSIFDQYKALNEGTLGQAQFLRNVKMALPKFISNTTSFGDAVKILKSKGIITEAKIQESMGERLADETYDELRNMLSSGKITQDQYNNIDDYLNDSNDVFDSGDFYDADSVIEYALKQLQMNVSLNEAKTEYDTHYCNPQEYNLGMRYELGKGTDEEKAHKIVYNNLKENAVYYSQLHLAGYNEDAMKKDRKKRTDLPIEVKKDNFVDTANGVKKVKMDKLTEDELKVLVGNILAEVADQKKTNLTESIEDNIAQIVDDKSSKYVFYNDKHKADMQKIFRMSAIKQILKNPNLTDEDKTKLETELEANKPEIKPTTQVSYPDSLADLIRQSSLD
jgi:hypothetical protein